MKSLFNKLFTISTFLLLTVSADQAGAAQPISFEGPKFTYDRKLFGLGDFATYQFMGQNKVDVAVPSNVHSTVVGMDNLNQWTQVLDNMFYTLNPFYDPDRIQKPIQVIEGNFNGSGASDLVVLNPMSLTICKDYTGAACGAGFSNLKLLTESTNWHAAVGKLKDGKDTIAVITQGPGVNAGKLMVYATDAAGQVLDPYYSQSVLEGTPYSLAIGDYDNDGKPDVAVASQKYNPAGASDVIIYFYKNTGAGFAAPVPQFSMKDQDCYTPTGLLSYDPDGDSRADLVLTCFDRLKRDCSGGTIALYCSVTRETGYVYILKNMNPAFFNLEHTISDGMKFPYSSAVGKFNGDALFDVAVANWRARAISVFTGDNTFKTEIPGKHYATRHFPPKYIQVADVNGDGLQDIVAVASAMFHRSFAAAASAASAADYFSIISEAHAASSSSKEFIYVDTASNDLIYATPDKITAQISEESLMTPIVKEPNKITYDLKIMSSYENVTWKPMLYTEVSEADSMARIIKPTDLIHQPDAVIVLVNYRPQVSFDPVNCSTTKVVAHCQATPGRTIASCVFNSADIPPAVANVQTVANGTGFDLTFNLPQEERTYTATVTATDDLGASVTETIVVKREGCTPPQTSVTCPSQKAHFEVWVDDPFQLCVPMPGASEGGVAAASSSSAYSVDFTQTGGPNIFAPAGSGSHLVAQTVSNGNCLSGRFAFPDNDIDVKGTYKIKNSITGAQVAECPWTGKVRAALIEGSGSARCSLDKSGPNRVAYFGILLLLFTPLFIYSMRKKFIPK